MKKRNKKTTPSKLSVALAIATWYTAGLGLWGYVLWYVFLK